MDPYFQSDDIKLTDLIRGFKNYTIYILKRVYIVIAATVLMYYGGRWFADISDKLWVASTSFNAIDARSGGGFGSLMSLASSFMGIGGGTSNDVLSGIFSSRNVVQTSFLEEIEHGGRKEKIINIYLEQLGWMDVFKVTPGMENFKFTAKDIYSLSPVEDSVMAEMYEAFSEDYMEIEFDPLAGLIRAGVYSPDKLLSTRMCEAMLRNTNKFYAPPSQQKNQGIEKLSKRVDSLASVINHYNSQLAATKDQNIFNRKEQGVVNLSEITREITVLNIQYNEAVSSLEAAKGAVSSETNVMRIVDQPLFSTYLDERDPDFWGLIGLAAGAVLSILILCLVKAANDGFEEEKQVQQKSNTSFT